ncbi:hypothetical protein D3C75_866600 [compost metagenome]
MGNQDAVPDKFHELLQHRFKIRRILHHFIGDVGQLLNMVRDFFMRIDKRRITVQLLAFAHFDCRKLGNIVACNRQTGGLDIEHNIGGFLQFERLRIFHNIH